MAASVCLKSNVVIFKILVGIKFYASVFIFCEVETNDMRYSVSYMKKLSEIELI